jgi:hypothetical protein
MTVKEMLARIDSSEIAEWQVYERMAGPLGGRRHDYLTAMITAAVVNSQRGKKPPVAMKKFVPEWERPQLSPAEMFAKIREINAALGGIERPIEDGFD